jgi:tetratricopeptide (TPR) repeat protein
VILCSLYAASAAGAWFLQSQSDQGTRWLERAIAAAPDPTDAIRAQALLALGAVRSQQRQLDLAQDLANDALHMYKRLGDRVGEAHCLNGLGLAAIDAGRSDEAEELLKTTVAICEETRDAQAREIFSSTWESFAWIEATGPGPGTYSPRISALPEPTTTIWTLRCHRRTWGRRT